MMFPQDFFLHRFSTCNFRIKKSTSAQPRIKSTTFRLKVEAPPLGQHSAPDLKPYFIFLPIWFPYPCTLAPSTLKEPLIYSSIASYYLQMVYLSRLNPYNADGVPSTADYQLCLKRSNDVIGHKRPKFIDKDIDRYYCRSRKTHAD